MERERPEVPTYCYFQGCYNPAYEREIERGKDLCFRFNALHPCDRAGQAAILNELLGRMGEGAIFTPPFWCDYGYNIEVGESFYANHNLVITDGAKVTFGDNVFIAPTAVSPRRSIPPTRTSGGTGWRWRSPSRWATMSGSAQAARCSRA